jgi:hypothetical protein
MLQKVVDGECVGAFRCASARAAGIYFQACSFNHSDISPCKFPGCDGCSDSRATVWLPRRFGERRRRLPRSAARRDEGLALEITRELSEVWLPIAAARTFGCWSSHAGRLWLRRQEERGPHTSPPLVGTSDYVTAHRFAPASRSVGSPVGNSPASFRSTMRAKFGGVGGSLEVTPCTKASSDASHSDNHGSTSPTCAWTARLSNAIGSLACAGNTTVWGRRARKQSPGSPLQSALPSHHPPTCVHSLV